MPLTRSLPETSGIFGSKMMNGYIPSSSHSGGGSLTILPITNKRFDSTQSIGASNRSIIFWRFMISKPVIISGVSLAFTANTATTKTLTSISESSGTATATSTAHGFLAGDRVRIAGATPSIYNGTKLILTAPTADTFTFSVAAGTGSASGTITAREFIGCGIYDSNLDDLFPRNKLADCAILPSTSNVITNLDANITLPSGIVWVGLGGSRLTNNTTLATIVTGDESTSIVNTYLTGLKTGNFAQFRGGCGIYSFDNESGPSTSDGNSGFKQTLTTGVPASGVVRVGVESNASAGSTWFSKCPMVGLVVV
jgi:hypothetical protein